MTWWYDRSGWKYRHKLASKLRYYFSSYNIPHREKKWYMVIDFILAISAVKKCKSLILSELDIQLKSAVFWTVTPFSSEKSGLFGEIHRLYLQGRRVSQARNHHEAGSK
jgi:hypothetical protein